MNLSLLIHTFDGYKHLWQGSSRAIKQFFPDDVPCYWGTDILPTCPPAEYTGKMIFSGSGEWSDRLRRLLAQIPTDYILYMQEDHWPTAAPPDLAELMKTVTQNDIFRLQISPIVHFYTLTYASNMTYFDIKSKYLVSHQPSIWKKSFLLSCLHPNESPWKNEYEGTKRLKNNPEVFQKIAIHPYDWFHHACIKGKAIQS